MYEYNGKPYSIQQIEQLAQEAGYTNYLDFINDNPGFKEIQENLDQKDPIIDPKNLELSTPDSSSDSLYTDPEQTPGISLEVDETHPEVIAHREHAERTNDGDELIEDPEVIKEFPKFKLTDFVKTNNKIIASQYQDLFLEDGFLFTADNNFITVEAPNGATQRFATQERKTKPTSRYQHTMAGGYVAESDYYEQGLDIDARDFTAQEKIDTFIKNNTDTEVSKIEKSAQANFTKSMQDNIIDYAIDYADDKNLDFDKRYPLASIRNDPEAYDEIKKNMLNPANQLFKTGLREAQQDILYSRAFNSLVNTEARDYSIARLEGINKLKEEGNYLTETSAAKTNHIKTITNDRDKAAAQAWAEVIKLKRQLDQTATGEGDTYLATEEKLEQAIINAKALFENISGDDKEWLYDPNTLQRINKKFATDEQRMSLVDYSEQYGVAKDKVTDVLKQNSFETTTNHYNAHNFEYTQWFDPKKGTLAKKYDLTITPKGFFGKAGFANEIQKLKRLGYNPEDKTTKEGSGMNAKTKPQYDLKGVSLKDLIELTNTVTPDMIRVDQGEYKDKDITSFDELLQAQEDGNLDAYVESVKKTTLNLSAEHDAWKNLYLLNIDPASIYKSNVSLFFEGASDASFGSDFTERTFGKSDSKILADMEGIIDNMNMNLAEDETEFNLTQDQKENFEATFDEELIHGLGGFVPMVAEFAAINYVTAGAAGAIGLTKALSKWSTVTYLNRTKGAANSINAISKAAAIKKAKNAGMSLKEWTKAKNYSKHGGGFFQQASKFSF